MLPLRRRRSGGIGRRARLRGVWGNPWGFESPLRHHSPGLGTRSDATPSPAGIVRRFVFRARSPLLPSRGGHAFGAAGQDLGVPWSGGPSCGIIKNGKGKRATGVLFPLLETTLH